MSGMFAAIAVGLMTEAHQAQGLQLPTPGTLASGQVDAPYSRDVSDQEAAGCPGDPTCAPKIFASPPSGGVSARTLAHKHSKAADKAFNQGQRAWNKRQSDQALNRSTA
jgi:hypothetical protein